MKTVISSATKSWRTTLSGVVAGIVMIGPQVQALLDGNPETVANWNEIALGVAIMFGLAVSRDNAVTSRSAGAE